MEKDLQKAGLTGNESKVYLELLRRGSIPANDLSKKLGMDRTLTYTVLNHLIEKGLVNHVIRANRKYFEASNPMNLLNPIKEKTVFVNDLIPKLKSIERLKEIEQEVNVYEGREGLRSLMRELLKHKSFCSFGSTGRAYDILYELPRIAKEVQKKGVKAKVITSSKFKHHDMTKVKNIDFRYLDVKSEATTSIFGNKVAIHVAMQKPFIVIINNKEIASSYKNHFEILWRNARKINH
ncbi:hypothetical protein JW711_04980 [Candidatus Woesearchaeota archaeon]|nr:hypothetical protein [Candidatus Woesearchaeota archaeon]